ncbi:MAG: 3-methyl-2-oxobutanoate hydroxymethyltransferase [Planctomycetes bacterium]|nr:3-methyl-2-oxobutanoate hydroxymethyltransferase [Planctomycetota bacterium]
MASPTASKVTVPGLRARKLAGEKIAALTAYDHPSGLLADEAGMDVVLVGDSLANTVLGYDNTLPVTLEEMLVALRAVRRAVRRALLVADMPFGSYQGGEEKALESAIAFVKAGAEAVKLEGGRKRADIVRRIVESEIPVMGHIGLTPQSIHAMGGYRIQGKTPEGAEDLLEDALALEKAGAFSVVIEGVPAGLAAEITARLEVPTIGIGAGPECDGQILVFTDLLGLTPGPKPRFARQYTDLRAQALEAIRAYRRDIASGDFPSPAECYEAPAAKVVKA